MARGDDRADLNTLVNCDIVHNVAAPPDPKLFPKGPETEWMRPGRAVWRYLDGGENTLEGMKEFSRLAGELGFEYNIVEGFWPRWTEAELRELAEYSKPKGVGSCSGATAGRSAAGGSQEAFFNPAWRAGWRQGRLPQS